MSGFSSSQLKKLSGKLDRDHVQSKSVEGKTIDYIEGWFAMSQANAIFGFGGWDRETVHTERLFERTKGEMTTCAYSARVRIRVRAGDHTVSREGTGCGTAANRNAGEAHERAIKAAETDATKRALATFGNKFGLCLYDKEQAGVSEPARSPFQILSPNGQVFADRLTPEGFCAALRKLIEATSDPDELGQWRDRNVAQIERLRSIAPDLKTQRGEPYADVLERLFAARLTRRSTSEPTEKEGSQPSGALTSEADGCDDQAGRANNLVAAALYESAQPLAPSRIALGPRVDKAALTFRTDRRLRDKAHLRRVGTLPCLICKSAPSHPHHLTFAQPRGLALKVSDEFVVPLCAVHHNELHRSGAEHLWWKRAAIAPLEIARRLWSERPGEPTPPRSNGAATEDSDGEQAPTFELNRAN